MKGITLNPYWAHLVLCGEATAFYTTVDTDYRGPLLLCSANAPQVLNTIVGHALCICDLVEVAPFKHKHLKTTARDKMPDSPGFAWSVTNLRYIETRPMADGAGLFEVEEEMIPFAPDLDKAGFAAAFTQHYQDKFVEGYRPVREAYIGSVNEDLQWNLHLTDFDEMVPEKMPLPLPTRAFRKIARKHLHDQLGTGYGFWCWKGTRKEVERVLREDHFDVTQFADFLKDHSSVAVLLVDHFFNG